MAATVWNLVCGGEKGWRELELSESSLALGARLGVIWGAMKVVSFYVVESNIVKAA